MERRLYTAGARKGALDPFLPPQPGAVARQDAMLRDVHAAFSAAVLQRRGEALRRCGVLSQEHACSGEVWTGAEAARNGMVDAVGDLGLTLRHLYGQVPLPRRGVCAALMPRPRAAMRCACVRRGAEQGLRRAQLRRAPLAARRAGAGCNAARGHAACGGARGLRALHALMLRRAIDNRFHALACSCQLSERAGRSFIFHVLVCDRLIRASPIG